jgi:hypothetical protein
MHVREIKIIQKGSSEGRRLYRYSDGFMIAQPYSPFLSVSWGLG